MTAPGPITHRGVVYPRELDHMGHMNVVSYVAKFDQATWTFFCDIGFTPSYLRTAGRALAAVRYDITYKRELLAGDVVTIRTKLTRVGSSSLAYLHEMSNGETGDIVATAEVTGVLIDRETRRSTPFPDDVAERLRSLAG
jgi:acyl-CoA thioester hydrolase